MNLKNKFKNLAQNIKNRFAKKNESIDFDADGVNDLQDNLEQLSDDDLDSLDSEETPQRLPLINRLKSSLSFFSALKQKLTKNKQPSLRKMPGPMGTSSFPIGNWLKKISPESLAKNFYDPAQRPSIHKIFMMTTLSLLSYSTGKITADFLKGDDLAPSTHESLSFNLKPAGDFSGDFQQFASTNLFRAVTELEATGCQNSTDCAPGFSCSANNKCVPTKKIDNSPCLAANRSSSLNIKVRDTVVLQDSAKSVASLEKGADFKSIREGDVIDGLAKVGKIDRLKLFIRNLNSGECEYLWNNSAQSDANFSFNVLAPEEGKALLNTNKPRGIKNEGNNYAICSTFIDSQMADFSTLLTQAKADPFPNPDGTLSFKLSQVQPGGVFSFLGLQEGDMISAINGNKIRSMQEVMNLFNQISKMARLNLGINRGGDEVTFDYNFDKSPDCESKDAL